MRNRVIISIFGLFFALSSYASKEVGNGGGISEQNIVFAKINISSIFANAGHFVDNKAVIQVLSDFIHSTKNMTLEFDYNDSHSKGYLLNKNQLTIFTKNINQLDLNKDGSVLLNEAILLYFQVYTESSQDSVSRMNQLEGMLREYLQTIENSQKLKVSSEDLQWSEYLFLKEKTYVLYSETANLHLSKEKLTSYLCQSGIQNLSIYNPYIKQHSSDEQNTLFYIGALTEYKCKNQSYKKQVILVVRSTKNKNILELIDLGVLEF